jgi:hypothetical protein
MNKLAPTKNELSSYTGRAPALTQGVVLALTHGESQRGLRRVQNRHLGGP